MRAYGARNKRTPMRKAAAVLCLALGVAGCAELPAGWRSATPDVPVRNAACLLAPEATVPIARQRNFLLVPVSIDGRAVTMVVDTGAEASLVTPSAARWLQLPVQPGRGSVMRGVGGDVRTATVRAGSMTLGGSPMGRNLLLDVGALPPFPGIAPPVAGLLGADLLARHEVMLDPAAGRMSLYAPSGCSGAAPWPGAVAVLIERTRSGLAFVPAEVNGTRLRALLDTGARTTQITPQAAERLGVPPPTDAPSETGIGIGLTSFAYRRHRFDSVGFPGALEHGMMLNIAPFHLRGVDMLLGADYLGARRIWISYASGRLFLMPTDSATEAAAR